VSAAAFAEQRFGGVIAMVASVLRRIFGLQVVVSALLIPAAVVAQPSSAPELPRATVDTTGAPPSGRTVAVRAGQDFQAALNAAKLGDVITLQAGATFTGPFTLPNKPGPGWIIVRTSAGDSELPPAGTRVDPSYARVMPKLVAAAGSVLITGRAAHHYRFVGIEIGPAPGVFLYNVVQLGGRETSVEELASHIIFERCYLHGDPKKGARRGIAMNSRDTAVIDSYLSDFKEVGADSQAIDGWGGAGPFKIVNNYLEGAGENVMFGGADPFIPNLVPSDIEIRGNHFAKTLSWKVGHPDYEGIPWTVKNLLELKNARRVLIEGNLFERSWAHAQTGFAILFTVRDQDGWAPWTVIEDVTFKNNVVRDAGAGIVILGRDDIHPSQQAKRLRIENNLFAGIGGPAWGGEGTLFKLLRGASDLTIAHNTGLQTGSILMAEGEPHIRFVFRDNVVLHNQYGMTGTGTGPGMQTLSTYFPGAVVRKNVIVGGKAILYPTDNFFPGSVEQVGFVDRAGGRYRLAASSRYRRAGSDGKAVGVDFDAISAPANAVLSVGSQHASPPAGKTGG
jgi:hypothetical protein